MNTYISQLNVWYIIRVINNETILFDNPRIFFKFNISEPMENVIFYQAFSSPTIPQTSARIIPHSQSISHK